METEAGSLATRSGLRAVIEGSGAESVLLVEGARTVTVGDAVKGVGVTWTGNDGAQDTSRMAARTSRMPRERRTTS